MQLDLVVKTLLSAENVAIYAHINTDCDAVGSCLALKEALEQLNKKCDVFINSTFPENFSIFGDLSFINKKSCSSYDLAVVLDSPSEGRLGKFKFTYRKNIKNTLLIDHHFHGNENFCRINYVKESSSTCELLYNILQQLKIEFTPSICKNLITGIITDTGKFEHSTSPQTFFVMYKLIKLGNISLDEIFDELINSMSFNVFGMLKLAYNRMEFFAGGKLAVVMFTHQDFIDNNVSLDDLDAFPDLPLKLKSVEFAILSSEDDKGYFRTSLRSKGNISARAVAECFGGGGHQNASGCKIFGEVDEVKQKLIDAVCTKNGWKK